MGVDFSAWKRKLVDYMAGSSRVRSLLYFGGAVACLEFSWQLHTAELPYNVVRFHLKATPAVLLLTYAFIKLRDEDRARWSDSLRTEALSELGKGIGMGAAVFASWYALAAANGWVTVPQWGWHEASLAAVAKSLGLFAAGHLAVAFNEEVVFRGWRRTLSTPDGCRGTISLDGEARAT